MFLEIVLQIFVDCALHFQIPTHRHCNKESNHVISFLHDAAELKGITIKQHVIFARVQLRTE